jgi:two-component system OmpR family sensor kinase
MLGSIDSAMTLRNNTLKQMRRFVADASHELRTPLVSVRGYAELYRMGALQNPDQVAEAMGRIESEAIRMGELVESLLALARLDDSNQKAMTSVELVALARSAAKDASVNDHGRQVDLLDPLGIPLMPNAELSIEADANQLRQVLTNLLANASRFSPEDAKVELALGVQRGDKAGTVIIEVRDHGIGIPEELREKVFERFFRADNSRNRETGGSGLGLAIAKSIVERHGGNIEADATPGGGATFRVILPVSQS